MESSCIRHTALPGTSRLFADYLYDFPRVSGFYGHNPRDARSFADARAELKFPDSRRADIVSALRRLNPNSGNLDRLAQAGTVAVITGQQVGLFSGPAYTIYKAVTAAKLARELTADGVPAVPVFWLATEDHDFPEVAKAWVFDADSNPVSLQVKTDAPADRPVGPIAIREFPIAELRAALSGFDFAPEVCALVEEACQPGRSMGESFLALTRRLLSTLDLIYLDPLDPAIRAVAAPFLKQAVEHGPELHDAVIARSKELAAAGYHAQVHFEKDNSLFFILRGDRRIALRRHGPDYIARDLRLTPQDLIAEADHVSPNALLRPVLQDYLLPSLAYVGGPAELAYFAQSHVMYEKLLGRMPVMLARNSFTLVDARSAKLLDRYEMSIVDLLGHKLAVRETIAQKLLPESLRQSLKTSAGRMRDDVETWRDTLLQFDPSLARALQRSRRKMLYQVEKIERKTAREALKRDERATADAIHVQNMIYPTEHLQERLFSILPFAAKYGLDIIDRVVDHACVDCVDHHVLPV